jgi:protein-L-isoaspartate O-methyltransferase
MSETKSTNYVLGTDQDELDRLKLQHDIWRSHTLDAWKRAGVQKGSRVLDVGAGPGYASIDLAELVGSTGAVYSVERSINFQNFSKNEVRRLNVPQIKVSGLDLMTDELPATNIDVAWSRWVCSFLPNPDVMIQKIHKSLKPGGRAVFFEYTHYASWQTLPRESLVTDFVERVMSTWKKNNCEADVAPRVIESLFRHNFEIESTTPKIYCAKPGDEFWIWTAAYMRVNTERAARLGEITLGTASKLITLLNKMETEKTHFMTTPMLLEIIARKPLSN